jgi:hypothetical protein
MSPLEQAVWVGIDPAGGLDARHAGKGYAFGQAETGMQLGAVEPERLDLDPHPAMGGLGDGQVTQVQVRDWPGLVQDNGLHRRGHGGLLRRRLWSGW